MNSNTIQGGEKMDSILDTVITTIHGDLGYCEEGLFSLLEVCELAASIGFCVAECPNGTQYDVYGDGSYQLSA